MLTLKNRLSVDIRHTLSNLPGPCLAINNKYFHVVREKKRMAQPLLIGKVKAGTTDQC